MNWMHCITCKSSTNAITTSDWRPKLSACQSIYNYTHSKPKQLAAVKSYALIFLSKEMTRISPINTMNLKVTTVPKSTECYWDVNLILCWQLIFFFLNMWSNACGEYKVLQSNFIDAFPFWESKDAFPFWESKITHSPNLFVLCILYLTSLNADSSVTYITEKSKSHFPYWCLVRIHHYMCP